MNLNFSKLIVHNFLSYGHSEIYLNDKEFCMVSGVNNCQTDDAKSNGSGKSSLFSAICWALTGETISGLKSNIKNINIPENECYVELDFSVDDDSYRIIRSKEPKSDLKIFLNEKDISGKGIRDSETILSTYLPDLTSQLIASIIILGQGLPNKFTSNTPSGRKDLLEKLSKSEFMIEDIKGRVAKRADELAANKRHFEDQLLQANSQTVIYQKQEEELKKTLDQLTNHPDFDSLISKTNDEIKEIVKKINDAELKISETNTSLTGYISNCTTLSEEKQKEVDKENAFFDTQKAKYYDTKNELTVKKNELSSKITRLKAITDICPTCGQKLPNIQKPDTSADEAELNSINQQMVDLENKYTLISNQHNSMLSEITESYNEKMTDVNGNIKKLKGILELYTAEHKSKNNELLQKQQLLQQTIVEKTTLESRIKETQESINSCEDALKKLNNNILYNKEEKEKTESRISIINQLSTLIKRDFRGVLLANVIDYIDRKAKEYSEDIFGTQELIFELDGNDINISYAGKMFENLSGGEKQRVDLIIQFSIRDLMREYLGFSSNILVLDEIFDNLDSQGCNKILDLISTKITDVDSIFIISHHTAELNIPFDTELIITKNEKGVSTIVCQ